MTGSIHGGVDIADGLDGSAMAVMDMVVMADSLRFTAECASQT